MDVKASQETKKKRIQDTIARKIPDRVPVLPNIETWVYQYAGVSCVKAFGGDEEAAFNAFKKFNEDIYVDGMLTISNLVPIKVMELFGEGLYTLSDDGLQIKGSKGVTMQPDDYQALIENPEAFFANVIVPRKYPRILQNDNKELLVEAFKRYAEYGASNMRIMGRILNELDLPLLVKGSCFVGPDIILDYLRDFVGFMTDVRRCPKLLIEASMVVQDYALKMNFESYKTPEDGGFVFAPLHVPTFLKPKDFEKIYLPCMKKHMTELAVNNPYTVLYFLENDWMPYLDLLQELPDGGKVISMFEFGDLRTYKERLGKKMVIAGGATSNVLALGNKQQSIDEAKYCLDTYAPGGNYIYATNMVLMTLKDAKPENVIAAFDYVRDNGNY